jgi:hypothetical protein
VPIFIPKPPILLTVDIVVSPHPPPFPPHPIVQVVFWLKIIVWVFGGDVGICGGFWSEGVCDSICGGCMRMYMCVVVCACCAHVCGNPHLPPTWETPRLPRIWISIYWGWGGGWAVCVWRLVQPRGLGRDLQNLGWNTSYWTSCNFCSSSPFSGNFFFLESSTLELFIFGEIFSTAAFVGLVREANPNPRFCHF